MTNDLKLLKEHKGFLKSELYIMKCDNEDLERKLNKKVAMIDTINFYKKYLDIENNNLMYQIVSQKLDMAKKFKKNIEENKKLNKNLISKIEEELEMIDYLIEQKESGVDNG